MDAQMKNEMKRIFELQRAHQQTLRATTAEERKEKLTRLRDVIKANEEELIEAIRTDVRKPPREIKWGDVVGTTSSLKYTLTHLDEWMAPTEVGSMLNPNAKGYLMYEPKGVCLILGPWNYPFSLVMVPVITAISAGNSAIVKPSELTPETARVTAKIIREAFDEAEVAVFEGDVDVATELLELPFDHIFFTGSSNVGKVVMQAAAKHLASVTLELGGKSPTIIDESYDFADAARKLAVGKLMNAGQTCIAPDYLFVKQAQQETFANHLAEVVDAGYRAETGSFDTEKFTQIVNDRHFNRIKALFDDAIEKGATVLYGGEFNADDRTISPTVLGGVTEDMKIMQEEIFAPILPLIDYETVDDAVGYINRHDKPLALYVFSHNQDVVDKVLNSTSSGNASVNDVVVHFADLNLPFGGVNASGLGSYHGVYGFREFSHTKGVFVQAE